MTVTVASLEARHTYIESQLFLRNPKLNYAGTIEALTKLAEDIGEYEGGTHLWDIGECGITDVESMLVGAYWFAVEYHGGMTSIEYRLHTAIGAWYSPGPCCSGPEEDSGERDTYDALVSLHEAD